MSHIFISYSRVDIVFAGKIVQALADNNLDTWIDWKSIPKGEDWEQEIYRGIEKADAFLFLISPDSVASQMCNKEIAHAVKNGKRIIPIVIRDTDLKNIHPEISKRNWIFCRDGQDDFNKAIEETRKTIHTDYEWLKYHTELQVKALKWEQKKDNSRLLRGKELREAEQQLAEIDSRVEPQPTKLHRKYVLSSRKYEVRQQEKNSSRNIKIGGDVRQSILIAGDKNQLIIQSSPQITFGTKSEFGTLFNVPPLPDKYLLRLEDFIQIKNLIIAGLGKPVAIVGATRKVGLQGMGGIGKSVLAAALSHDEDIRRIFPDGIIWLTFGQTPNITARQAQLADAHGEKNLAFQDPQQGKAILGQILANKACLVILDDVWNVFHVAFFDCLSEKSQILITTRDISIVEAIRAEHYIVEVFSRHQALDLLAKWAGQAVELLPDEAIEVAKECGYLPLALAMIGAIVNRNSENWEQALFRLKNADLKKIHYQFPDYPYPDLLIAIQVSVNALPGELRERYLDFAVFPEDTPIPVAVFFAMWATLGLTKFDVIDVLDALTDRSLIRRDTQDYITMHDLQFDFVRRQVDNLTNLHNQFLNAYSKFCSNGWPTGPNDGYFFQYVPYHLNCAHRIEELQALLLDFDWLHNKLDAVEVSNLIADYGYALSVIDNYALRLLQGSLRLSAQTLANDKNQLASQLFGRLQNCSHSEIETLLNKAKEWKNATWFQPLTSSLLSPSGALQCTLRGHSDWVRDVAIIRDSQLAISASDDCTIILWDLQSGLQIQAFKGHKGKVKSVAVTPDGKYAVSASEDYNLIVWDLKNKKQLRTLQGHKFYVNAVAITPDGQHAISASSDCILKQWDLRNGELIYSKECHDYGITDVAITPDGMYAISASDDCSIKVWEILDWSLKCIHYGHDQKITSIAISSDSKYIVSASFDGTVKLWDTLNKVSEIQTYRFDSIAYSVAVTPDNQHILLGFNDNKIKILDRNSGQTLNTFESHYGAVRALAVTSDGKKLISAGGDNTLKYWNLETKSDLIDIEHHAAPIRSMAITQNNQLAITASDDRTIKIWSIRDKKTIQTCQGHTGSIRSVVTRYDNEALTVSDDQTLKMWNLTTGKEKVGQLFSRLYIGNPRALAFTSDRKKIVATSGQSLILRDLEKAAVLHVFNGYNQNIDYGIYGKANDVIVTPDDNFVISAHADGTIRVWELENIWKLQAWYKKNRDLLSLGHNWDGIHQLDNEMASRSESCGKLIRTLRAHKGSVNKIALVPGLQHIISASSDHTIKEWNFQSGELISIYSGHNDIVRDVAVMHRGLYFISASDDNTVKLWRFSSGDELATFTCDFPVYSCKCTADVSKLIIIAGDHSGRVHFLRIIN